MTNDLLWNLLCEMNSSERKYFRRNYISVSKELPIPLFLQLFDYLCQQKEYIEKDILLNLRPELTKSNLSYTKHYLYEELCQSLLLNPKNIDLEAKLYQQLSLIKILRQKGLYQQALKKWEKANSLANQYEVFSCYIPLKEEYRKLQLYSNPKITLQELTQQTDNTLPETIALNGLLALQELNHHILLIRKKAHFGLSKATKVEIPKLLKNTLIHPTTEPSTFWQFHYVNNAKATLYFLIDDGKAYAHALANIINWQKNPQFITREPDQYLEVLYIFYYTSIQVNSLEHIEKIMQHRANELIATISNIAYYQTIKHLALNRYYNRTKQYKKVADILKTMKKDYQDWLAHVSIELQRTMYMSMGIACFVLDDLDDAYYLIKQGVLLFNDQTRPEQYTFAHLFSILICYEKNEFYHFQLQCKSSILYFKKKNRGNSFELIIIEYLKQAFNCEQRKEKTNALTQLKKILIQNSGNIYQEKVFNYFNIPAWLDCKIKGIPYRDRK